MIYDGIIEKTCRTMRLYVTITKPIIASASKLFSKLFLITQRERQSLLYIEKYYLTEN